MAILHTLCIPFCDLICYIKTNCENKEKEMKTAKRQVTGEAK